MSDHEFSFAGELLIPHYLISVRTCLEIPVG
jgi:hypothetical protein